MTKKIVPKSTNYKMVIDDNQVQDIIKNTPKERLKTTIDNLTRQHLRKKFKDKVIEGEEKVNGVTIGVWYVYE